MSIYPISLSNNNQVHLVHGMEASCLHVLDLYNRDIHITPVLLMVDGGPWRRGKIPPYRPQAVIADYGRKPRNSGRYLPLRQARKLSCKSAIADMAGQFDNTA